MRDREPYLDADPHIDNLKATSRRMLLWSSLLLAFFYVGIKLGSLQTGAIIGKPMPDFSDAQWLTDPAEWESSRGKVVLLFFLRTGSGSGGQIIKWSLNLIEADSRGRFAALAVVVEDSDIPSNIPANRSFNVIFDKDDTIRKYFRNNSLDTYYLSDKDGIIRHVGNAGEGEERLLFSVAEYL